MEIRSPFNIGVAMDIVVLRKLHTNVGVDGNNTLHDWSHFVQRGVINMVLEYFTAGVLLGLGTILFIFLLSLLIAVIRRPRN